MFEKCRTGDSFALTGKLFLLWMERVEDKMSSTVTRDLVTKGKLLIHVAENGHSIELGCDESTLVESVQRWIESETGIQCNDQLLLCLDMKLESNRPLSMYKLPSDDREVFLFNKSRLHTNSPPPNLEQVDVIDFADPPSPSSSQSPHPLDDAADPALKALPSYERQFRHHFQRGHAIFSHTQVKYETCERLLREQKVQERAMEIARGNLGHYYRMIHPMYNDFMKCYSQQHRIHSDLLVNFGREIEKLRSCKLHPSLQTANRKCLLDFVIGKEENLRKRAENCSSSHRQFEAKVSQFKQMFSELKHRVDDLFSSNASSPIRDVEMAVKEHQRYINEQKSIMQSLSKDVNTVKKLVDDCLSCQLSSSLRPHDAVSALGRMYDVHDKNHLPKIQVCDTSISRLLDFCKKKKDVVNLFVHNYMQDIACIQYIMKDIRLQFSGFKEAMVHLDDIFEDLKVVRGIGPAYRACLAEVVRRRASMKLYMGLAGQLAERVATKRELEVRKREEFIRAQSLYIPRDILASMGLYDTPSQCDVNIAPYDTNLLDIDISDIERYAPEYLASLPSKVEKRASSKGSFSISNESSHSAETEVNSVQNLDEGIELVEIAGTSKMEVENAKLKAELASAIALICSFSPDIEYESLDDSKMDNLLKNAAEKTAEALHLKDEYGKHLQSMLKAKQLQCESYEKRIQELEQRLSDQYLQNQSSTDNNKNALDFVKSVDFKSGVTSGEVEVQEPMDELSWINNSLDGKVGVFSRETGKSREGADENMSDSSGILNNQLDSSMLEPNREENEVGDKEDGKDKIGITLTSSSTAENILPCEPEREIKPNLNTKMSDEMVLELRKELEDKSNQLRDTEIKLKAAIEEVSVLGKELETSRKLLDESQMNCAHLENYLHEAREEAQMHLCAADRRASQYTAARASAKKMRGLFERLRVSVTAPTGVSDFASSLRVLAQSLANSVNENEDDGTAEFCTCIRVLADRVSFLSRHRAELLEKYSKAESANEQVTKELEEKKELVNTLYTKHQLEKQANKEKICFGRLEVHEIAAFVLHSSGHYQAISRNCSNYYLSAESVALFMDHLPSRPIYIVGQIVHIERRTVMPIPPPSGLAGGGDQADNLTSDSITNQLNLNSGSATNPYGLPIGCEYFVVTVAMLPETTIHSPPPS